MSGALNSVMGGGGSSSLLGDIDGIIGGAEFGPIGPIGAMVGQALGNMLQQAIQSGMSQATSQLQQQGMPSYVANMVNDQTAAQTAQNTNPNVPADIQQQTQDQYGAEFDDLSDQLGAFIVSGAVKHKAQATGGSGGSGAAGAAGGSTGGAASTAGGWLQAIAAAMGEAMGKQAETMVDLSNKLSSEVANPDSSTGSNGQPTASAQQNNAEAARQFNMDMTSFQAQSQQYSILQNTFTNALQSLGQALQGMARKS